MENTLFYLLPSTSQASLNLCHGQMQAKEPHYPWGILQLQKTPHLQEIKAQEQGECKQ